VVLPGLNQHLGLSEAGEDFAVEQFVAERSVEALVVTVLPRRARRDVERLHADLGEPDLHGGGNEPGAVVRPDMSWRRSCDEQIGKRCEHVFMLELARHNERQSFPAGLVDDGQDPELVTIMRPAFDEVISPYMPRILRS